MPVARFSDQQTMASSPRDLVLCLPPANPASLWNLHFTRAHVSHGHWPALYSQNTISYLGQFSLSFQQRITLGPPQHPMDSRVIKQERGCPEALHSCHQAWFVQQPMRIYSLSFAIKGLQSFPCPRASTPGLNSEFQSQLGLCHLLMLHLLISEQVPHWAMRLVQLSATWHGECPCVTLPRSENLPGFNSILCEIQSL